MKKINFFFAAAALAMTACTSNEALEQLTAQQVEGLEPINLGYTTTTVSTRGTGTVGGVKKWDEESQTWVSVIENNFGNQNLYVFMTTGTGENWDYTKVANLEDPFTGAYVARAQQPKKETLENLNTIWGIDYMTWNGGQTRYYPTSGSSDFFAVHLDDAAGQNPVFESVTTETTEEPINAKGVEFTIDGNNDLMAGKAWKSAEDFEKCGEGVYGYSAKTSRVGVVPRLHMKHLLSRFTFEIVPGHSNCKGMFVDAISFVDMNTDGVLYVAYELPEEQTLPVDQLILWNDNVTDELFLKGEATAVLDPADVENDAYADQEYHQELEPLEITEAMVTEENIGKGNPIGDALFVRPTAEDIQMKISTRHYTAEDVELTFESNLKVKAPAEGFEPGKSYKVKITVYGIEEISVEAELEPWIEADDVDVDIEEDVFE